MRLLLKKSNVFILFVLAFCIVSCKKKEHETEKILEPQPFPTTYGFPVAEATLIGYAQEYPNTAGVEGVYTHAWQIWSGLTADTGIKTSNGHSVRVFESWRTPQQIQAEENLTDSNLFPLTVPHQLGHGTTDDDSQLAGFVKYSPAAEKHVVQQGLFDQKVAKSLIASGASQIIGFPTNSIMIKPVFLPVKLGDASKNTINVWQGPPKDTIRTWGSNVWPNSTITIVKDAADADNKTKFAISDFINFKVDETFTTGGGFANFKPGDHAVLVGMHVMTKETTRWTWQSFWWSQYPDKPHFPSSKVHASYRNKVELDDASKHYAMTAAYSMKVPAQPYINGKNVGESIYAYNPYLEAGFGPKDSSNPVLLGENEPGVFKGKVVQNNYGIQTTCMSCHIQARWPLNQADVSNHYNGNRYVNFQQSYGKDTLQLDFLWSVNAALGDIKKK